MRNFLRRKWTCELGPTVAIFALLLVAQGVLAADVYWRGHVSVDWSTDANWRGGSAPGASDNAIFNADSSAGACQLSTGVKVNSIFMDDDYDQDFDQNGQACTTATDLTADGSGTITLDGAYVMTGDGNFAFESGPTYSPSQLQIDSKGTGSIENNTGSALTYAGITCGYADKTTTVNGNGNHVLSQLSIGSGTLTADRFISLRPTASGAFTTDAASTINGSAAIEVRQSGVITVNIPRLNARNQGINLYSPGGSLGTYSFQDTVSVSSLLGLYATGTGGAVFQTNDFPVTAGTILRVGAGSTGKVKVFAGASEINIGSFETTTYNTGVCSLYCETSTINDSGDFDLGSNTVVVPGTSDLRFVGTAAATPTMNNQLFYDIEVDKTGGSVTFADSCKANDYVIAATNTAPVSHSGQETVVGGDYTTDGSGTLNTGTGLTANGASSTVHFGSTLGTVTATATTLTMNTATAGVIDDDKGVTFSCLELTPSAIVVSSGVGEMNVKGGTPPFVLGDNSSFTNNHAFRPSLASTGDYWSIGTGVTWDGTGNVTLDIEAAGITCSAPAVTYTGSGVWSVGVAGARYANWTWQLTGDMDIGTATWQARSEAASPTTIDFNDFGLTCGTYRNGSIYAGSATTVKYGTGTHDFASINLAAENTSVTTHEGESANIKVAGAVLFGTNAQWIPTADTLTLDGTGAQAITVPAGDTLGNLVVTNTTGPVSTAQNTAFLSMGIQGPFDMSADTVTSIGDVSGAGASSDMIYDAASLLRVGGSITGFDGDTLPHTILTGSGGF